MSTYTLDEAVLIPGTPIFGCPVCYDPWESEPSCEHYAETATTPEEATQA